LRSAAENRFNATTLGAIEAALDEVEYRAVSYDKFGQPRSTLARAEKDAEQMQVASTQRESRIQVRASDPETSKTSPWTFLDEGSSS
jgi:hypothetical protein